MTAALADFLPEDRLEWHQKIFRRILDRETPASRHHADNRVEARRKRDLPADDLRIGRERAPPAIISQDNNPRIDVVLRARVATPEKRRYAEDIENVGSNRDALGAHALLHSPPRPLPSPEKPPDVSASWIALGNRRNSDTNRHRGRRLAAPPLSKPLPADPGPERQRFQKDGVDDAEDRGVRPHPEGKSQDRDEGERGMFDELAESVTDVVDHILF